MTLINCATVGYGDYVPYSVEAKYLMMLTALLGSIMISLFVLIISSRLELSKEETMVFRRVNLSLTAAHTIQSSMKYFILKKKFYLQKCISDSQVVKNSRFLKLMSNKQTWIDELEKIKFHRKIIDGIQLNIDY